MNVVVSTVPFWKDPKDTLAQMNNVLPGVEISFGWPSDTDVGKQIDEMETLITKRVDGIVIAPADAQALVPVINKAVDAGIPVVTVFTDAPSAL